MPDGIVDAVEFAATAVLAAPVALLGLLKLAGGEPVTGVGFVVIAGGMLAVEEYLVSLREIPGLAVGDLFDRFSDREE